MASPQPPRSAPVLAYRTNRPSSASHVASSTSVPAGGGVDGEHWRGRTARLVGPSRRLGLHASGWPPGGSGVGAPVYVLRCLDLLQQSSIAYKVIRSRSRRSSSRAERRFGARNERTRP
jgi:hypothetical protein